MLGVQGAIDVMETPQPSNGAFRPDQAESRFSFVELWQAVRKNWALATGTAVTVVLGVMFFTLGETRIYESSAIVMFDPTNPQPLGSQLQTVVDTGGQYWNNKEYYKTQMWMISSQRIAQAVVR